MVCSPHHPALKRSDDSFTLGSCDNNNKTIYISDNLNERYQWKVVCHEIVHAVMFSYDINLNQKQEEVLADIIATYGKEIMSFTDNIIQQIKNWENL